MKKLIYLGLLMSSLSFAKGYVDLNLAYGNPYFKLKGGYGGIKVAYDDNAIKIGGFAENKIDNINIYVSMGGRLGVNLFQDLISPRPRYDVKKSNEEDEKYKNKILENLYKKDNNSIKNLDNSIDKALDKWNKNLPTIAVNNIGIQAIPSTEESTKDIGSILSILFPLDTKNNIDYYRLAGAPIEYATNHETLNENVLGDLNEALINHIKEKHKDKLSKLLTFKNLQEMYRYNIKIYDKDNKDTNLLNYEIKWLIPLYTEMGISYSKDHLNFSYNTEIDYENLIFNITEGNHSENGIDPENDMFDSTFTGTNFTFNNKLKFEYKDLKHFNLGSKLGIKYIQSTQVMEVKKLTNNSSFKNFIANDHLKLSLFKNTGKNIYVTKETFFKPSVFANYDYKIKGFTIMPGTELGMIYYNYQTKNNDGKISDVFKPSKDTNINAFDGYITPTLYLEYKFNDYTKVYSDNSLTVRIMDKKDRIDAKAGFGVRHEW